MSLDQIISEICNSRIWEVILIGDRTTLLDNRHQFMRSLHAMDSRSRTRELSVSLLFIEDTGVQLVLYSGMLNQLYSWILKEPILLWVPVVPVLSSYTLIGIDYEGRIGSRFIFVHIGVLVIMQGCVRISEQDL